LVFVWPIGKSKQKYFTGVNQKKYFTEGKPEMTYITGVKTTPFFFTNCVILLPSRERFNSCL